MKKTSKTSASSKDADFTAQNKDNNKFFNKSMCIICSMLQKNKTKFQQIYMHSDQNMHKCHAGCPFIKQEQGWKYIKIINILRGKRRRSKRFSCIHLRSRPVLSEHWLYKSAFLLLNNRFLKLVSASYHQALLENIWGKYGKNMLKLADCNMLNNINIRNPLCFAPRDRLLGTFFVFFPK